MAETLTLRGELKGHRGWVTAVAPPLDAASDVLLSSSRYVSWNPILFLHLDIIMVMVNFLCTSWSCHLVTAGDGDGEV